LAEQDALAGTVEPSSIAAQHRWAAGCPGRPALAGGL